MKLIGIGKQFADKVLYRDFNLEIRDRETTVIMGASGCGKTTLLNMTAGLTSYDGVIEGQGVCAYVFQEPRLIPSLTVAQNLIYACGADAPVREMLSTVELTDKADEYASKLSGGEQQRVSLARAYLYPADTVLFDEPFRALDPGLKERLIAHFARLQSDCRRTNIYVTHDAAEALAVGDRIIVLGKGQVLCDMVNTPHYTLTRRDAARYDELINFLIEKKL